MTVLLLHFGLLAGSSTANSDIAQICTVVHVYIALLAIFWVAPLDRHLTAIQSCLRNPKMKHVKDDWKPSSQVASRFTTSPTKLEEKSSSAVTPLDWPLRFPARDLSAARQVVRNGLAGLRLAVAPWYRLASNICRWLSNLPPSRRSAKLSRSRSDMPDQYINANSQRLRHCE